MTFLTKIRNFIREKFKPTGEDAKSEMDERSLGDSPEQPPVEQLPNDDGKLTAKQSTGFFNICQIFTDGSMAEDGKSGSCFVLHNVTTDQIVYKCYRLDNQTSSCVSEYCAIYKALTFLLSNEVERSYIELYTDVEQAPFFLSELSNKTVLGKSKTRINLTLLKEKIRDLRAKDNVIEIKWIRRNTVLLNKYADLFAREGAHLKEINFDASIIRV